MSFVWLAVGLCLCISTCMFLNKMQLPCDLSDSFVCTCVCLCVCVCVPVCEVLVIGLKQSFLWGPRRMESQTEHPLMFMNI